MKKLLDFAVIYGIKSGMHGPTTSRPSAWPLQLHLDLAIHNFRLSRSTCRTVTPRWTFSRRRTHSSRGYLRPGETPGLGVELNEQAAAAFEYTAAYPPREPVAGRDDS